ncbi:hypothetical protein [Membranihabitans maritimus]|uniref:hypothetical protein n=1 Tax=Membranihabitans maritimus TaxID=2904244 RepID=UPI001F4347CB|nr:hypothetical protein [Membranihabitans maritimus]
MANDEMMFNDYGKIAHQEWIRLKERFPRFQLDVFQIMPNHMHAILVLDDLVGATLAVNPDDGVETNDRSCDDRAQASRPLWLGITLGHINPWWSTNVYRYTNHEMKSWGNYGNVIIMNISSGISNHIRKFPITSSTIRSIGKRINFTNNPPGCLTAQTLTPIFHEGS